MTKEVMNLALVLAWPLAPEGWRVSAAPAEPRHAAEPGAAQAEPPGAAGGRQAPEPARRLPIEPQQPAAPARQEAARRRPEPELPAAEGLRPAWPPRSVPGRTGACHRRFRPARAPAQRCPRWRWQRDCRPWVGCSQRPAKP